MLIRSFILVFVFSFFLDSSLASVQCSKIFQEAWSSVVARRPVYPRLFNDQIAELKSLIRDKQFKKAEQLLSEFIRDYPLDSRVLGFEIDLLIAQNKIDIALQKFQNVSIGWSKSDVYMLSRKATLYKKQGDLRKAMEVYEDILLIDSNNKVGLSQGGYMSLMLGDYTRAKKLLDHAQHIEPHNREVFWNRLLVRLALGNVAEVEKFIEPINASNLRLYAVAALEVLKENYDEAILLLNETPLTPAFLRLRAQAYFKQLNFEAAKRDLIKIIQLTEKPDYFTVAALLRIDIGDQTFQEYKMSPTIAAISKGMDTSQLLTLVQVDVSEFWKFKPQTSFAQRFSQIQNSFWNDGGGMYPKPVDSKAVREVRNPRK